MTDKNQSAQTVVPQESAGTVPEDEINLLEIIYVLIRYKFVIALFSVIGLLGGYAIATLKGPTYVSNAVIMAKEGDNRQSPNFGGLGALGGLAAAQLNLAGNPGLDNIGIYLDSREFRAELIEKYDLLDDIYRYGPRRARKFFDTFYDTIAGRWREEDTLFVMPAPKAVAGILSDSFLKWEIDPKVGVMTITVKSSDSTFTDRVIAGTLEHLDYYIKTNAQMDAKNNVDYLEEQLLTIADPLLREKILGMIAAEIEKAMVISKEAFKVVDTPFRWFSFRERLMFPVLGAFAMFMMSAGAVIFLYYVMGAGNTNAESQRWVVKIKKQLFRII